MIKRTAALASIAGLLGGAGCGHDEAKAPLATPVTVFQVRTGEADATKGFAARIRPDTTVRVSAQVGGVIDSVGQIALPDGSTRDLQRGDSVSPGTLLVTIDCAKYTEKRDEAIANAAAASATFTGEAQAYTRSQALYQSQVDSKATFDQARASYGAAKANVAQAQHAVEEAQIQVDWCTVKATSTGIIIADMIEAGDVVHANSLLYTIGDVSTVRAVFGAPPTLLPQFSLRTELLVDVDSIPDRQFLGRIVEIAPSADPKTGVFEVEVALLNRSGRLSPGLVAHVQVPRQLLEDGTTDAVSIPLDAVIRPPGEPTKFGVYVLASPADANSAGSFAKLQAVELGPAVGNRTVVRSGLADGQLVIVRGATIVTDGSAVRVIP